MFASNKDVLKSPDNHLVNISIDAYCHDCKHLHEINVSPDYFGRAAFDWEHKHRGHNIEFLSPKRKIPKGFDDAVFMEAGFAPWWLDYKHNADIKAAYAADGQFNIAITGLASSSTWTFGVAASSIANDVGLVKYLDYEITGKVTTGTGPTANSEIRLYGIKPINDTPTWFDPFTSTTGLFSITNSNVRDSLPLLWSGTVASTNATTYPIISALTLAQLWGFPPSYFTVFLTHSNTARLNPTGATHELSYRGLYETSI